MQNHSAKTGGRSRFWFDRLEERIAPSTCIAVSGNVVAYAYPAVGLTPGATQGFATGISTGTTFASSSASVAVLPS